MGSVIAYQVLEGAPSKFSLGGAFALISVRSTADRDPAHKSRRC